MIVRVPDYFSEFSCIAGDCKDSCCLGWEIDIDEDSYEYYQTLPGEVGERLRKGMYETEDGGHGIRTNNCGRCIMLNDKNLCDLYIAAGEASLSEVCTDFPRFGIEYRNVEQKCLSLACEEVCRIFFSKTKPVKFVEQELFGDSDDDQGVTEEEAAFFEEVQRELIAILQDRTKPIGVRVDEYLDRANEYQKKLSQNDDEKHIDWLSFNDFSYEHFDIRFGIINQMELLRQVWQDFKDDMQTVLTEEDYEKRMKEYMASSDYRENDIEQLLVYFTFMRFDGDGCGTFLGGRVFGDRNQQFSGRSVVHGNPVGRRGKGIFPFHAGSGHGNLLRSRILRPEGERRGGYFERCGG